MLVPYLMGEPTNTMFPCILCVNDLNLLTTSCNPKTTPWKAPLKTVIQPHPQMFSLLILPYHLNSGMLGFHVNLQSLPGWFQVSPLSVQPDSPLPAFICKMQVWAIPSRLSNPRFGDHAGQFRWHHPHLDMVIPGGSLWPSATCPPIPGPLTSLYPAFQTWTMCFKVPFYIQPPIFLFFIVKWGLSSGKMLSSWLLYLRYTYFILHSACI